MFDRRMPGDEVQKDPDAALARRRHDLVHLLVRPVTRGDLEVVGHVIAGVSKRRRKAGVEPNRVDPKPLEVAQVFQDTREIAHAVAVGVGKRLRIDLVEDRVVKPGHGTPQCRGTKGRRRQSPMREAATP